MPSDFIITVFGNNPKPAWFTGSSSGISHTLKPGKYSVSESSISGYSVRYSSGCSGSISIGKNINLCTVTNVIFTSSQTVDAFLGRAKIDNGPYSLRQDNRYPHNFER